MAVRILDAKHVQGTDIIILHGTIDGVQDDNGSLRVLSAVGWLSAVQNVPLALNAQNMPTGFRVMTPAERLAYAKQLLVEANSNSIPNVLIDLGVSG